MSNVDEPTTEPEPGAPIVAMVDRTLQLARTWIAWDGCPRLAEDGERVYTPHKVVRRTTDHLIDHLAQVEALVAGLPGEPDRWHGSTVTTASDLAPFSEIDLREAEQRLRRLAQAFAARLASLPVGELDRARGAEWTVREIVAHVANPWYAEQLGNLIRPAAR